VDRERTEIGTLLFRLEKPLSGEEIDIVLNESYDQSYGIFNHDSPQANPLSIVSMHESERYTEGSGLYNQIARYLKHPIKDRFGLDLIDFLNLPREYSEELIRLSAIGQAAPTGASDADLRKLEQELRGGK